MSDIDFLSSKDHDDGQEPKAKDDKKDELAWSKPEADKGGLNRKPFFNLPFLNPKKPDVAADKKPIDKNKLKESRREILKMIKSDGAQERDQPNHPSRNFISALSEKFIKRPNHKDILIDYQQIFNQEKSKRGLSSLSGRFASEDQPVRAEQPAVFKQPRSIYAETGKSAAPPKIEPAEEVKKEIKYVQPPVMAPAPERKDVPEVLETNLIKGEIVTFFDWRKKSSLLIGAIIIPIFLISALYLGVIYYQKINQAKNQALEQKYIGLLDRISQEELGLEEIIAFQANLNIYSQVLSQHLYWTNFFKFLEDNTIKDVYYNGFSGDTSGNYSLETMALNYANISEQVKVFKANKLIAEADASGGELVAGGAKNISRVKFILKFSIAKSIFTE